MELVQNFRKCVAVSFACAEAPMRAERLPGFPKPLNFLRGNGAPRGATLLSSRLDPAAANGETAARTALRRSNHAADPPANRPQSKAREHRCKQQHPLRRFRLEDPAQNWSGNGGGLCSLRGPRNESARSITHSFRRLSPPLVRSASRRKRHLPVVGAGGSTSASRVAVCVTNRAGAGLVPLQVRLRKRPHERSDRNII